MIKITVTLKDNKICNVKITGHAKFNEYGKDIVCASVSSIAISTINGILSIDKDALKYDDTKGLNISSINDDYVTCKLIDNMINMFKELQEKYPKNISIRKEEL